MILASLSILEIVLLILFASGLTVYFVIMLVKTLKKKKNKTEERNEEIEE